MACLPLRRNWQPALAALAFSLAVCGQSEGAQAQESASNDAGKLFATDSVAEAQRNFDRYADAMLRCYKADTPLSLLEGSASAWQRIVEDPAHRLDAGGLYTSGRGTGMPPEGATVSSDLARATAAEIERIAALARAQKPPANCLGELDQAAAFSGALDNAFQHFADTAEQARQRGDCREFQQQLMLFEANLEGYAREERLSEWRQKLAELKTAPCPATASTDGEDILGEVTPPRDLLGEHPDEPAAAPPAEDRHRVVDFSFAGEFGQTDVPPISAGVLRMDAGDEKPAGASAKNLDIYVFKAGAEFPLGHIRGFVEGSYSSGKSRTVPFAIEPGSAEAVGFSFGQETDNSTGLILGSFAGETGSIRTDFDALSIKAGVKVPIDYGVSHKIDLGPMVLIEQRQHNIFSKIFMTTDIQGFMPDIGQERRQELTNTHIAIGGALDGAVKLSPNLIGRFQASAAVDYLHSSFDSDEHNHCDVCTGALENFTIETHDSANDVRFRGGLGAALEVLLSDKASLTVGGSLDLIPARRVENPVTGDDVLDGKTTRLGGFEYELSFVGEVGFTVWFK